jgi:hypothetical protein
MNYYVTYGLFKETGTENFDKIKFELGKNKDPESEIVKKISKESGEHPDNIYIYEIITEDEYELLYLADLDIDSDLEID